MSLFIENSITINAPQSKVWHSLVNPEQTKSTCLAGEAVSDWRIGSPLLWKGLYEGKEMIFVKGSVVEIKPERFLAYTVIDPNSTIEDIPENYLTVTYELTLTMGKRISRLGRATIPKLLMANGDIRIHTITAKDGINPGRDKKIG